MQLQHLDSLSQNFILSTYEYTLFVGITSWKNGELHEKSIILFLSEVFGNKPSLILVKLSLNLTFFIAVDLEDVKRESLEQKIDELKESIYLNNRDQEMIKMVRKSCKIF